MMEQVAWMICESWRVQSNELRAAKPDRTFWLVSPKSDVGDHSATVAKNLLRWNERWQRQ